MTEFKEQVKKGFQACKDDISTLFDENNKLNSKIDILTTENLSLKSELSEIKSILNSFKDEFKNLSQELKETKQIVPEIQQQVQSTPISQKPIQSQPTLPADPYEALLAFKAKTNKRDMLKQKMLSMVGENGLNLAELKFMIVDHFKYCSKATFYNYLKELELERHIKIEREHSKNIVYLSHLTKEI